MVGRAGGEMGIIASRSILGVFLLSIMISSQVLCADIVKASPAKKTAVFISAKKGGMWSNFRTWESQDGLAPKRMPGEGDSVLITGPVTVDKNVSLGDGIGTAVTLSVVNNSSPKLIVAAELTLRGSLSLSAGSVLEGISGGIEFDADKDVIPKISVSGKASILLNGKENTRFFIRTKSGSAGLNCSVEAKGPLKFSARYVDFTGLGSASKMPGGGDWGRPGLLLASPAEASTLEFCNFTDSPIKITNDEKSAPIALTRCIMTKTSKCGGGGVEWGAWISCEPSNRNITLEACGFDRLIVAQYLKSIRSCVLQRNWYPFKPVLADEWTDNICGIVEAPGNSAYFKPPAGVYNRTYWFCLDTEPNAHFMFLSGTGEYTFSRCIWDAPVSPFVDDALNSAKEQKVLVEGCLTLLRGGTEKANLLGVSLGYIYGGRVIYRNNTLTLGPIGVYADTSHGGKSGDLNGFFDNICWLPAGAGQGEVFYNSNVPDWFKPEDVHHNALFNAVYFKKGNTSPLPLAKGDIRDTDPRFVDPLRNLTKFHREQNKLSPADKNKAGEEGLAALDWFREHPEKVPELLDWVFEGFRPRNRALKASSDPKGRTKGWIGALEGLEGK
ncbi:MAG: hypothetical protein WCI43_01720 [Candidatus Firestonebacteria bacterium]